MTRYIKSFLRYANSDPLGHPVFVNSVDLTIARAAVKDGYGAMHPVLHNTVTLYPGELPLLFAINERGRALIGETKKEGPKDD